MFKPLLRSLRGPNLEIFKFGMYLAFPIGWMYYFGTNLDERFTVPGFWPTQEQSHKLPKESEELAREVERIRLQIKERVEQRQKMQLEEAKANLRQAGQSND
ncbi:hypothetical protein DV735_g3643, partial [Chaetothyriales sp. CBS 134920]